MLDAMLSKLLGFFLLLTFGLALVTAILVPYFRNKYKPKNSKDHKDDDCGCGGGSCSK